MADLNVTAELEVDDGAGTSRQFSVNDLKTGQTGAATEASLTAGLGVDGASPPTIAGTGVRGWLRAIYDRLTAGLTVTVSNPTGATDVSALATSAKQDTQATKLDTLHTDVGAAGNSPPALATSASGIIGWLRKIVDTLTGGIGVTGTFWQATQPVSAATLPLPSGAATDATLGTPGSSPPAMPGSASGLMGWLRLIYTTLSGGIGVTGTFWQATQPVSIASTVSVEGSTTSRGYAQATSTGTAALLSALVTIPSGATKVLLYPSAQVRVRDDGTPTASVGYPLNANEGWTYDGQNLASLKVINAATIDCWFYS